MVEIRDTDFVAQLFAVVGRDESATVSSVYVSPYLVAKHVAGVVITASGTPPRATLFFPLMGSTRMYTGWGTFRAIDAGTNEYDAIMEYLVKHRLVENGNYVGPIPPTLSMPA